MEQNFVEEEREKVRCDEGKESIREGLWRGTVFLKHRSISQEFKLHIPQCSTAVFTLL